MFLGIVSINLLGGVIAEISLVVIGIIVLIAGIIILIIERRLAKGEESVATK